MLSRHGNKQPSHPIPGRSTAAAGRSEVCASCRDEVFSSSLHQLLTTSRERRDKDAVLRYSRSSRQLYASVMENWNWCESLTRGILTATHLDYWFDKWNGSHSDGSTDSNGESNEDTDMDTNFLPQQDHGLDPVVDERGSESPSDNTEEET